MQILIHKDGQQYGPYSPEDIAKYLNDGSLSRDDLAWHEGLVDWIPLSQIPGLSLPPAVPPPPKNSSSFTKNENAISNKETVSKEDESNNIIKRPIKLFVVIVLSIYAVNCFHNAYKGFILAYKGFTSSNLAASDANPPATEESTLAKIPTISSLDDVRKNIVGTWTYTGQEEGGLWYKFVFHSDGTLNVYHALPVADNWGEADNFHWKATTGKFIDTGERWYGADVEGWMSDFLFFDGQLEFNSAGKIVPLDNGDKFPFSK